MLVEVRKPGRPLSSCPHPSGSCSCERIVINYTIPKSSECACPSGLEIEPPTATVVGNSRIQKNRRRPTLINASSVEKAVIQLAQDATTDPSSVPRTPTERSGSNAESPLSSASSTPRLLPAQTGLSSCCKPEPSQLPVQQSGCCSSKVKQLPEPVPPKSCCAGPKPQANTMPNVQPNIHQHYGPQAEFQLPRQFLEPQYQRFYPTASAPPAAALPYVFSAPIYNHVAAAYQQPGSMSVNPVMRAPIASHTAGPQMSQQVPEHNCRCGPSCSCFGCAAHPNNATTVEYVRDLTKFQYTGDWGAMSAPFYDMPIYHQPHAFGAETFGPMSQDIVTHTPANTTFQGNMNMPGFSNTPMSVSGSWQPPLSAPMVPESQFLEQSDYAISTTAMEGQLPLKEDEQVSSPIADNSSDGKGEEASTLSPSSYLWTQMVLPGCTDATGTCHCGDGCACDGCLTHGGHNGVPYDAFSDFTTNAGLALENDTAKFSY